jgi:hypothetical protein
MSICPSYQRFFCVMRNEQDLLIAVMLKDLDADGSGAIIRANDFYNVKDHGSISGATNELEFATMNHNRLHYRPHTRKVNRVSVQDVLYIIYVIMKEAPKKFWGLPWRQRDCDVI